MGSDVIKMIPVDRTVTVTKAVVIPDYLRKFLLNTRDTFKPEHGDPGPICLFHARIVLHQLHVLTAAEQYGVSPGRMMVAFMNCFDQFPDSLTLNRILDPEPVENNLQGEEVYVFTLEQMTAIAGMVNERLDSTADPAERDKLINLFERIHGGKPWPPVNKEGSSDSND